MTSRYEELVRDNTRGQKAEEGLRLLREAREAFKAAGATDTLKRVRAAISSAKGAVRHAGMHPVRQLEQELLESEAS